MVAVYFKVPEIMGILLFINVLLMNLSTVSPNKCVILTDKNEAEKLMKLCVSAFNFKFTHWYSATFQTSRRCICISLYLITMYLSAIG